MDVVDPTKCEFAVRVVSFVFETTSFELVGLSTQSRSSIIDCYRCVRIGLICFSNFDEHLLIVSIQTPKDTILWLSTSPNRTTIILVKIRQRWQPILRSKTSTSFDILLFHCPRHNNLLRIACANIILIDLEQATSALYVQALASQLVFYTGIDAPAVAVILEVVFVDTHFVDIGIRLAYLFLLLFEKAVLLYQLLYLLNLRSFIKRKLHLKLPLISSIYLNIVFKLILICHMVIKPIFLLVRINDGVQLFLNPVNQAERNVEELLDEGRLFVE